MLDELKEEIQRINRTMGIGNGNDTATASVIRRLESESAFNSFDEEMNNQEQRMILVRILTAYM